MTKTKTINTSKLLPPRSANTMGDAIALSSPSGRMSKRARREAEQRLSRDLFGETCTREDITGRDENATPAWEIIRRSAADLRALAAKGMQPRKFSREAERLEREADELEARWKF